MIGVGVVGLAGLRHFRRHPWQLGLAVLGIALGVALAVGIDVASASVRRAFALSSQSVTGRATHEIVGGPTGVDEAVYRALRLAPDRPRGLALAPFAGGVGVPEAGGGVLQLLGIDLFAEAPFRDLGAMAGPPGSASVPAPDPRALLTRPGAAMLSVATAARLGVARGDRLPLRIGARRAALWVVGLMQPSDDGARRALDGVAIVDVATAQELTATSRAAAPASDAGRGGGRLTRIDLMLPAGDAAASEAALRWVQARLPPGLRVAEVAARSGALAQLTRAFDLNLTALSLLALLVGGFLIYNTMSFSVIQRRRALAILRTLGVARGQLARNLLLEALALGLVGSTLGVALGALLSRSLVRLTARAVSDLYFTVSVTEIPLALPSLARGLALGVAAAVAAAWPAARDAATTDPVVALHRSALEARARSRTPRLALAGAAAIALALVALLGSRRSVPLALAALLVLLTGCAALAPAAVLLGARAASAVLGRLRGATGRLAARSISAGLSRTGVATAALALALAVTSGVSLMVTSFRAAVERWLASTLRADVYVTAPMLVSTRPDAPLPPALVARLRGLPGVAGMGSNRLVTVQTSYGPIMLSAPEPPQGQALGEELTSGDAATAWPLVHDGEGLLVSEPFAFKHPTRVGDRVSLATDRGWHAFTVAGIYRDYGSDAGALVLGRRAYLRYFDDPAVTAISLYAARDVPADRVVDQVRARLGADDVVLVRSNRALRENSLRVFDRTFDVTRVLRLFALIVACFGVTGALMAVALERGRELATLRALGATPAQCVELTLLETGVLGGLAGLLAIPLGLIIAAVLIFVINQRSFGWTMPIVLDPRALLTAPLLGVAAGLLSGLFPAWRAARISPAEALRDE
jgi:putative ABC transport system permease protein